MNNLNAAVEFFVELGLILQGEGHVKGSWVDRIVGLEGVQAELVMMGTPDDNGRIELVKFHSPQNQSDSPHAAANAPGLRHIAFAVDNI